MQTALKIRYLLRQPSEWYRLTLPHEEGRPSPVEFIPLIGVGATLERMVADEPNLTDTLGGLCAASFYHGSAVAALYSCGYLLTHL